MNNIIEIANLKKHFKEIKAVDDLTFKVKEGELFAFLGLNGAGKSTTISIMSGQLKKDAGSVIIDGMNIENNMQDIKSNIGIVFQNSLLDSLLTVKENLKLKAALYGITGKAFENKLDELSFYLNLKEFLKRPLGKLSGGQRRRVDVARALLHEPKLLILDEPTTGLDPQSRIMVWQTVEKLRQEKRLTVFLTTHYMEEASDADYVVILDKGKIAAEGTPNNLKNQFTADYIKLYGAKKELLDKLNLKYTDEKTYLKLAVSNTSEAKKLILNYPELFEDFEIVKGKMDDVFLAATGKMLKEE